MMDFVVDKVSEDSFYINLLLGMPKQLEKYKKFGAKSKQLSRALPVSHADICAWEHRHGVLLPEDLRNFYSSTDGFIFTWTFNLGFDKSNITGKIQINSLNKLVQVFGFETICDPGVNTDTERFELQLGSSSKLYDLVTLENDAKVVLIYLNSRFAPTVWIKTSKHEFYFLADNFTTYFRMAVAHLGIPNWHLLFAPNGVPQWTENMIRLFAPNLLKSKRTIESVRRGKDNIYYNEFPDVPSNKLDLNIFKCLPKNHTYVPRVVEKEKIQPVTKSPKKKKLERQKHK